MTHKCPVCRTENGFEEESCRQCNTPLRGFSQLSIFPDYLFNQGLSAAQKGDIAQARDFFAAVVQWCPMDHEARNVLAQACFELNDYEEARRHWELVLQRAPSDRSATRGLETLERQADNVESAIQEDDSNEQSPTPPLPPVSLTNNRSEVDKTHQSQEVVPVVTDESPDIYEPAYGRQEKPLTASLSQDRVSVHVQDLEGRLSSLSRQKNLQVVLNLITVFLIASLGVLVLLQLKKTNNRIQMLQTNLNTLPEQEVSLPTAEASSLDLTQAVAQAIEEDERINWLKIQAEESQPGSILLSGEVYTDYLKNLVEQVVTRVEGVELIDSRGVIVIPTYSVRAGDTLWKIAQNVYGDGYLWNLIFQENQASFTDAALIDEADILTIPDL